MNKKGNAFYRFIMALKEIEAICEDAVTYTLAGDFNKAQNGIGDLGLLASQAQEALDDIEWYSSQEEEDGV